MLEALFGILEAVLKMSAEIAIPELRAGIAISPIILG